ncbi:phosphoadenosine phosphosulfate reductase family protein [uncultured Bacteroides sp.]|uniref:phosphoadenosine phosphosulfate reductase family protein n=1 Tax=uncultured Bacteroides sp. TaxID=162156 RepID=UPI0025DEE0A7|nr:phosphoadenosine phosphosulfate reductase family protein [uncultured Bacteroides sp.]
MNLQDKIEYSIALLRKCEQMALDMDPENGFRLAFSGGKDSQALYHIAKMAGVKFKAHMNLTSVDPPEVIRFVKRNYPDVELIKPKMSIYDMAKKKHVLPTKRIRWCCAEYKESSGAGKVILIGIRKQESIKRSKRNEFETGRKGKATFSGTFDQWSEHTETMVACVGGKDQILISPIINWTEREVWEFLNGKDISHCKLYDEGYNRIGCILCPMASFRTKVRDIQRFPYVKRKWIKVIQWLIDHGYAPEKITESGAEFGFNWWLSGKGFDQYYADEVLQQKIEFNV